MASPASEGARRNVEQTVWLLTGLSGLPANVMLIAILWSQPYSFEVRWTIASVIVLVWLVAAAAARQVVTRTQNLAAQSRTTIAVNTVVANTDVSMDVTATLPI